MTATLLGGFNVVHSASTSWLTEEQKVQYDGFISRASSGTMTEGEYSDARNQLNSYIPATPQYSIVSPVENMPNDTYSEKYINEYNRIKHQVDSLLSEFDNKWFNRSKKEHLVVSESVRRQIPQAPVPVSFYTEENREKTEQAKLKVIRDIAEKYIADRPNENLDLEAAMQKIENR